MALSPEVEKATKVAVTADDVYKFFDARKVHLVCEVCGATDWSVHADVKISYIPVALATCRNCGNMRAHSLIVIQMWKSKALES